MDDRFRTAVAAAHSPALQVTHRHTGSPENPAASRRCGAAKFRTLQLRLTGPDCAAGTASGRVHEDPRPAKQRLR
jgi:hypothetical protein